MENSTSVNTEVKPKNKSYTSAGSGIYGLGIIGAMVYYIQHAETFWMGVLGVLKAFVWPAFLVHKLMEFLQL